MKKLTEKEILKIDLYSKEYWRDKCRYWKDKCRVLELEAIWLDELCNYERENQYQLNDPNGELEEWKEEIEELELNFRKEKEQFNKTYNL